MILYLLCLLVKYPITLLYINIDPEHDQFIVETSLPTPIWQGLC